MTTLGLPYVEFREKSVRIFRHSSDAPASWCENTDPWEFILAWIESNKIPRKNLQAIAISADLAMLLISTSNLSQKAFANHQVFATATFILGENSFMKCPAIKLPDFRNKFGMSHQLWIYNPPLDWQPLPFPLLVNIGNGWKNINLK